MRSIMGAGAAGVLGRTYYGIVSTANGPSGCYSYINYNGNFNDFVRFNADPTGAPNPNAKPLCAGKPAA